MSVEVEVAGCCRSCCSWLLLLLVLLAVVVGCLRCRFLVADESLKVSTTGKYPFRFSDLFMQFYEI
jgi:hypothetical protein